MHFSDIAAHRLHNQHLAQATFATPTDLVTYFGAMQAQDFAAAKWGLGLRLLPGTSAVLDKDMDQAFDAGEMLRTHILRTTWHFVAPKDIRWIQALTSPRVNAALASPDRRELELDAALLHHCYDLISAALRGGQCLTRDELSQVLAQAGIQATGRRLGHIIMHAELEALICSGPRRGKQFTYALLDERVPQAVILPREQALAELALRYFTSHGPATVADFTWWSSLTTTDTRAALGSLGSQLTAETINGQTYYLAPASQPAPAGLTPMTYLLPPYDEYTIAYKDHRPVLDLNAQVPTEQSIQAALYSGSIAIGSQVIGQWRRTLSKQSVQIELTPFRLLSATEEQAIGAAAERYGRFLGMVVELTR